MLPIVQLPTASLRVRSIEMTQELLATPEMQQFAIDMIPAMYHYDGIGLAAPQVGKNIRMCVIGKNADKKLKKDLVLINPVWQKKDRKTDVDTEGCLSVPNTYGKVRRCTNIHVDALAVDGTPLSFDAKNLFARVVQHEVDHLDGILFIDRAKDIYTVSDEEKEEVLQSIRSKRENI